MGLFSSSVGKGHDIIFGKSMLLAGTGVRIPTRRRVFLDRNQLGVRDVAETVIQEDMTIQGNLVAKDGAISVGGKVTGDIDARSVGVLAKGVVKGAIGADEVRIAGLLEGSVKCGALALDEESELKADVTAGSMTMSSGAKISGRVEARGG